MWSYYYNLTFGIADTSDLQAGQVFVRQVRALVASGAIFVVMVINVVIVGSGSSTAISDGYWGVRDPTPSTRVNEYMDDYCTQVLRIRIVWKCC